MKRVAIIDLGSNTARLVVLAYDINRSYRLIDELREVVRLSEGMGDAAIIRADAFERGISALCTFRAYCDAVGITNIHATATSAVRDAANGESFLAAARERANLELRILAGEEEAYYGTLAVANSLPYQDAVVLDLGGGSAQLSLMKARQFVTGSSWPIGAVKMTERFFNQHPPKKKDVKALIKHVRKQVGNWYQDKDALPVIGMGGTLRNLADIHHKKTNYPVDLLHGYELSKDALNDVVEDLLSKSVKERGDISGLNRDRADIIAAGGVVIRELLELSGASGIVISGQGIREGLFYPSLVTPAPHLVADVRAFSVENLARQYYDHPAHNQHVQMLALLLFDQLAELHSFGSFERDVLAAAALVHDIGMAVNYYDHHKHGFYLAMSAALPGFTHREQALIALLVRYHRKGKPDALSVEGLLLEGDMDRVMKLAALLRLAEYLERSKAQRVTNVRCHVSDKYVQIEVIAAGDAQVEVKEAALRSDLLENAYGVTVDVMLGHAS